MGFLDRIFGNRDMESEKKNEEVEINLLGATFRKKPVCDICDRETSWEDGYALTTRTVVTNTAYWEFMFTQHPMRDDSSALSLVEHQAKSPTGWLVCGNCASLFNFNHEIAKKYAKMHSDPPGSAPANLHEVALAFVAAGDAWKKLYGESPNWKMVFRGEDADSIFKG